MKVKDGKLSLGKNDTQVGNFVVSKEKMHFKMQDINGYWSTRVAFMHPMYMLIEECLKVKNKEYLEAIAKILYAISTTPPDKLMLETLYEAYNSLCERMKAHLEPTDDDKELQRVKDMEEAKEELKKIMDDTEQGDTAGQPL